MKNNKGMFFLLVLASAIVAGDGLHMMITPPFWGADSFMYRIRAISSIIIGIALFLVARRYRSKPDAGQSSH